MMTKSKPAMAASSTTFGEPEKCRMPSCFLPLLNAALKLMLSVLSKIDVFDAIGIRNQFIAPHLQHDSARFHHHRAVAGRPDGGHILVCHQHRGSAPGKCAERLQHEQRG